MSSCLLAVNTVNKFLYFQKKSNKDDNDDENGQTTLYDKMKLAATAQPDKAHN